MGLRHNPRHTAVASPHAGGRGENASPSAPLAQVTSSLDGDTWRVQTGRRLVSHDKSDQSPSAGNAAKNASGPTIIGIVNNAIASVELPGNHTTLTRNATSNNPYMLTAVREKFRLAGEPRDS